MTNPILDAVTDIIVPIEQYRELLRSQRKLDALEAGGVDNWEWYGEAMEAFWAEEEQDD